MEIALPGGGLFAAVGVPKEGPFPTNFVGDRLPIKKRLSSSFCIDDPITKAISCYSSQ